MSTNQNIERGSSYLDLTIQLKNPLKGLINLKNNDNRCFNNPSYHVCKKEILNDPQRQTKYKKYEGKLNYTNITFSVTIKKAIKQKIIII